MKKICLCNPSRKGFFGDTVRVVELFGRIPRLLNNSYFYVFTYGEYKFSDLENIKFINLDTLFFGRRIRFVSKLLSNLFAFIFALFIRLDLVYEIQTTTPGIGLLLSKIKKIPLVYEVNTLLEYEKEKTFFNNIAIKIARIIEKWTVRCAKKITVVTTSMKKKFHEEYKILNDKIEIVPNGANIEMFYPMDKEACRNQLGLDVNSYIVCFVGGLGTGHGAKNLIECSPLVLNKVNNVKFLIVGDGPKKKEMEEKAKLFGVENAFIFAGIVPREKVPLYINSSDVCIALYALDDRLKKIGASSVKIHDYMGCSKPVIASDKINGLDVIQKSNSGILVDINNPLNISKNVIKLLKDEKMRKEMGINGRKLVEEKYNWESIAKQVSGIVEESLKNDER
ncbi:glycosyltransferase family 4 protein [Patescibacteria group bacterium]|nr:glycosyltransferase family 4 protein [Patescibacteria group bacterium]